MLPRKLAGRPMVHEVGTTAGACARRWMSGSVVPTRSQQALLFNSLKRPLLLHGAVQLSSWAGWPTRGQRFEMPQHQVECCALVNLTNGTSMLRVTV